MRRVFILAALAALLLAGTAEAKLIKEMQVTRSGKIETAREDQITVYRLVPGSNKMIIIGDREFFPPATRAALDQAVQRKLTVEITGHLLIYNDQPPVFTLPLHKIDVKGLEMGSQEPAPTASAPSDAQGGSDVQPFKDARLKSNSSMPLGKAMGDYAFFSERSWRVLEPGKAEFRGELDLSGITDRDSHFIDRLRSKDLHEVFKSLTFVAHLSLRPGGVVECSDPAVEAVYQDGTKDRLVWKEPATYYWDRIFHNRQIKIDYFLSKAAQSPDYGKGTSPSGTGPAGE
jgi:hypothetical protein